MLDFNYVFNDRNSDETVLLLHGFLSDLHSMKEIEATLTEFNTLLIDLPGFGGTKSVGTDYDMNDIGKAIVNLVDELQLKTIHVYGYSMGGRVAISLLANHSERFNKFILESTSPGMSKKKRRDARIEIDELRASKIENDFNSFIDEWEELPLFKTQKVMNESKFLNQRKDRLSQNSREVADSLRKYGTGIQPHYWDDLDKNNQVLIIVGRLDEKFVNIGDNMNQALSNSRMLVVDQCGHNIHLEQPYYFIKQIKQFLLEDL